jgi:hypothetical protein
VISRLPDFFNSIHLKQTIRFQLRSDAAGMAASGAEQPSKSRLNFNLGN